MAFAAVAQRSKRRLVALTVLAGALLWGLLTILGTFGAWALANAVWQARTWPALIAAGAGLGLIGAVAITGTAVRHAGGRVHAAFRNRLVAVDDLRWRRVVSLTEGLAISIGIPAPKIYVISLDAPNAMAVGIHPDRTAVYLTTGLMDALTRDEQEAVLASVMVSIARRDIAIGTAGYAIGDGLVDLSRMFRDRDPRSWPFAAVLAPFGVMGWITKSLVLRWRGEGSDTAAMAFTRNPAALHSALVKIRRDQQDVGVIPLSTRALWFEYPLDEASATTARTAQRPVSLDRRIELVARALRSIDPSWDPAAPTRRVLRAPDDE